MNDMYWIPVGSLVQTDSGITGILAVIEESDRLAIISHDSTFTRVPYNSIKSFQWNNQWCSAHKR